MERIYFYKLKADSGAAPCVRDGLLSLAICKPMIRTTARIGDLVFGFAANSLHRDNHLIYAARITQRLDDGEYYKSDRYSRRGDRIYTFRNGRFRWLQTARFHGPDDLTHDLGKHPTYARASVLLSSDFRYFGKNGDDEYKLRFPRVRRALEQLGRGHRVRQNLEMRDELLEMKNWLWRTYRSKVLGGPTNGPSRRVCYRAKSCGVT